MAIIIYELSFVIVELRKRNVKTWKRKHEKMKNQKKKISGCKLKYFAK